MSGGILAGWILIPGGECLITFDLDPLMVDELYYAGSASRISNSGLAIQK